MRAVLLSIIAGIVACSGAPAKPPEARGGGGPPVDASDAGAAPADAAKTALARPLEAVHDRWLGCPLSGLRGDVAHRAIAVPAGCRGALEAWTVGVGVALEARDLRAHLGCPDDVDFGVDFAAERVIVVREWLKWNAVVETDELVVIYHPPYTPPGCPGVQGIERTEDMERAEAVVALIAVPRSDKPLAMQSCYQLAPECSQIP